MDYGGAPGGGLIMCQEIYFGGYRDQSPEYPDVCPDIRAALLIFIMRKSTRTRHITEAESQGLGYGDRVQG
jgi:hypothetical protein